MDIDKLVDAVTKVIMERLNAAESPNVVVFGDVPQGLISGDCNVKCARSPADIEGCDYIVLSAESFRAFHSGVPAPAAGGAPAPCLSNDSCRVIDLTGKRLIHERDLRDNNAQKGDLVKVSKNAIITALAYDYAKGIGVKICKE